MTSHSNENEIWKDIPNYEGIYQVSNLGRIRTCEGKTTYSVRHGVRHWKQRIIEQKMDRKLVGFRVILYKDKKPKTHLVHRLVATTFLGESDLTVNHIDGNRFNNRLDNLEWCSREENIKKGFDTGLYDGISKGIIIYDKKTNQKYEFKSMQKASKWLGKNSGFLSTEIKRGLFENENYKWEIKEKMQEIEDLLKKIKEEREKTLYDYNRFLQNQNAYKDNLLICKGKIMAFSDLECYIKIHREALENDRT